MTEINNLVAADKRWQDLELLQKHYAKFEDFLYDVITEVMGFNCTWLQLDISHYLVHGDRYRMVQAQRGQCKTTIVACYAVWRLIHNPKIRVLILSAGGDKAIEISNWVIQIIMNMPELECMRPDTTHGDRCSVKAFDIHYALKGIEKSPSIACMGITANLQGSRADLLIADDIESGKNSQTATMREQLAHITKDFSSICSTGDVIYLGTPQNVDSIYNGLPSRGFDIRIWTGRYPTPDEIANYGTFLAPSIIRRLEADPSLATGAGIAGESGQPTDPDILNDDILCSKELDQGKAYFQLQHMLNTKLTDADRYPLKSKNIVFMTVPETRAPMHINWTATEANRVHCPQGFSINESYYGATGTGEEFGDYSGSVMYVDPAGGGANGDETAYSISKFLAGRIFIPAIGGVPGGYSEDSLNLLTQIVIKHKPKRVLIEENYGKGAFRNIWSPMLNKALKEIGQVCGLEDVWESGQKELRIIDTLEPILASHRLVIDPELIQQDWKSVQKYPVEKRITYSLFFQLARITRGKNCLIHDDRLDALAGSCRPWVEALAQDAAKIAARAKEENWRKLINNPLGNGRKVPGVSPDNSTTNAFNKFRRMT